MPLSRRNFVSAGLLLPFAAQTPVSAIDSDWLTSAIVPVLDMLPDRPGPDGLAFPVTSGADHLIKQQVGSENPEMYWDPAGEDYLTIFSLHPSMFTLSATQGDVSIWKVNNTTVDFSITRGKLQSHGWKLVDEDLGILRYAGSNEERRELANSLNILGSLMLDGVWDWVAIPDVVTVVSGTNEEVVRQVADRVKYYSPMTPIWRQFHGLKPLLKPETYVVTLLPPQSLAVETAKATFVAKSWTGDVPIVQSIGLRLDSPDQVKSMIETINERLEQEISPVSGDRYSNYLELVAIKDYYSSIRFDLMDHSGVWDVTKAWSDNDLGFLPKP